MRSIISLCLLSIACPFGCQDLWSSTLQDNIRNCVTAPDSCGPEEACSTISEVCEPALSLDAVTPVRGPSGGGLPLVIQGHGFLPGTRLMMGAAGMPLASITLATDRQLAATLPASRGTCGRVPIQVSRPGVPTVRRDDLFSYFAQDLGFASPSALGTSNSNFTVFVAAQDLSGDGITDIVATAYAGSGVDIFLGNGDGTFQTLPRIPTGAGPYHIAIADIDGNGAPDIAVACNSGNSAAVILGTGGGQFKAPLNLTNTGAFTVHFLDADSDGIQDLAVMTSGGRLRLWKGDGLGGFTLASDNPIDAGSMIALSVDVDGDGRKDLVANAKTPSLLNVFRNAGDGTFPLLDAYALSATAANCIAADVNLDAKVDVICSQYAAGLTSVFLGHGDGSFDAARSYYTYGNSRTLAAGDFNCDGFIDIAVGHLGNTKVVLLMGHGDGSFDVSDRSITIPGGTSSLAIGTGDLNHDQHPDLIVGVDGISPAVFGVLNTSQ